MPLGLWTPPFPFSSRSNQAGRNLFYTCFIFTADLRISPYTAAHFSPKNGSTPAQSSNEGSPSMPEHPHHIRSEAYKYRFDLLFASLLCTIVVNIFFPEDIYDGIAQTIYLPIQLIAGITLFDIRRKGYLLTLLIFLGGLLIVGRLLDSFTPLNLREYLVFAYVVFFGWVTLELFRQIYTAPLVDRESVLAALCGLLLIGYGDITPHTWVAKNATILVALIAYMYSLVIVAMIVNQFAENRKLKQQEKARLSGSAQARRREAPPSGENG